MSSNHASATREIWEHQISSNLNIFSCIILLCSSRPVPVAWISPPVLRIWVFTLGSDGLRQWLPEDVKFKSVATVLPQNMCICTNSAVVNSFNRNAAGKWSRVLSLLGRRGTPTGKQACDRSESVKYDVSPQSPWSDNDKLQLGCRIGGICGITASTGTTWMQGPWKLKTHQALFRRLRRLEGFWLWLLWLLCISWSYVVFSSSSCATVNLHGQWSSLASKYLVVHQDIFAWRPADSLPMILPILPKKHEWFPTDVNNINNPRLSEPNHYNTHQSTYQIHA